MGGGLRSAQHKSHTQDTRPFVSWPVSLIDFNLCGPITAEFQAPIPSSSSALRSEAARRRRFPPEAAGCVLCDALYCYVFSWFVWCPRRGHITTSHRITSDFHRFIYLFLRESHLGEIRVARNVAGVVSVLHADEAPLAPGGAPGIAHLPVAVFGVDADGLHAVVHRLAAGAEHAARVRPPLGGVHADAQSRVFERASRRAVDRRRPWRHRQRRARRTRASPGLRALARRIREAKAHSDPGSVP